MHRVLGGVMLLVSCAVAMAQSSGWPAGPEHAVVTLWPKGATGVNTTTGPEADTSTATSRLLTTACQIAASAKSWLYQ